MTQNSVTLFNGHRVVDKISDQEVTLALNIHTLDEVLVLK